MPVFSVCDSVRGPMSSALSNFLTIKGMTVFSEPHRDDQLKKKKNKKNFAQALLVTLKF